MDEPFAVVKLSEPLEAHGETLSEIPLKEPDLKVLKGIRTGGAEGFDLGQLATIVSRLGGVPPKVAEKIKLRDLVPLKEQFEDFFDVSL